MAAKQKKKELGRTVDLGEIYSDFVPVDKLLQTNSELSYRTHSPYWDQRVNQAAVQMEKDLAEDNDLIEARENPQRPEHYKTVDAAEEYNGMLLQTDAEL